MKAELLGIMVDLLDIRKHQAHESLISAREAFDRLDVSARLPGHVRLFLAGRGRVRARAAAVGVGPCSDPGAGG